MHIFGWGLAAYQGHECIVLVRWGRALLVLRSRACHAHARIVGHVAITKEGDG